MNDISLNDDRFNEDGEFVGQITGLDYDPNDKKFYFKKSWEDEEVREKRSTRNRVIVFDGAEHYFYFSVKRAFQDLDLPLNKHQRFRTKLKLEKQLDFLHNNVKYTFSVL